MATTAMMTVKAIFLLWSISCGSILAFSPSLHFIRHEKSVFVSGRSGATGTLLRASSIASTSFGGSTTTTTTSTTNTNTPFWSEGLNFTCSACGKCCQNKGEVWFNTEEFTHLVEKIQLPVQDVLDFYVEEVQSGWVKLKSKEADGLEECIFLSNTDHKSCTIYEQRPVQCRTYPYWSRLLGERKEWIAERVEPEEREGRHWSLEEGGCEGIEPEHIPKTLVPPRTIYMNRELYEQYSESFPFMTNGQDVDRLKTTTAMMQSLLRSTKAWINNFVVKYNLCPFAEQVFTTERVRYAMSLTASTREQIITKFKEEVYYILTHPEDVIETTLIVLPFAMKDFEDWYDFTLELEEDVLPGLLKEIHNKSTFRNSKATPVASGGRLAQRLLKKQKASEEKDEGEDEDDELQIACFHPTFMWSSEDDEDPLADFNHPMHYEKRAPFPTINILRTKQIQAFASQSKTFKIAKSNEQRLQTVGSDVLRDEFRQLLQLAL